MKKSPPSQINDVSQLEQMLSEPTEGLVNLLANLPGDILILGAAGKMGPTLSIMAKRASDAAQTRRQVIAVSRFSNSAEKSSLESAGIKTIKADLIDKQQLNNLPDAPNVIFMAGMKFGATGNEPLTWAMNTLLPAMVCRKFAKSRIAAFSTGNVYGLSPLTGGGSVESDSLQAVGDYAMSCVGRERMFEYFSKMNGTPVSIIRLNYATEMRYGVMVDLASKVWRGEPISLAMGNFNAIWQADANAMALESLRHASSPPFVLNVAGPEMLSVRRVCQEFGQIMKKSVEFVGAESPDALLNNGQLGHHLYGYPRVSTKQMIAWISDWIMRGGDTINKPTHFESRDGKF
ncbi:MAG TPA: NAD-dependent epimerase/dehydratase family protein [Tepidisphaeraceae bacterium]|jgi:nucleoside-diphosphate-sugar epimerase